MNKKSSARAPTQIVRLLILSAFLSITTMAPAGDSSWVTMPDDKFNVFLEEYKANPSYLAENPEVIRTLSGEQLSKAIDALGFDHFTYLWPVVRNIKNIPQLKGKPIEELSVMAIRKGKLVPIPFQVDELDTEAWVYIKENPIYDLKGKEGIFDEDDELLFMYRDTGIEKYSPDTHPLKSGKIMLELEFNDKRKGINRYAYIVSGSKERSTADYVHFDVETNRVNTTFYSFQTKKDNILEFTDFKAKVGDRQDTKVLDALIVNIATNVFSSWSPRIKLDNFNNLKAAPFATKDGAIRSVTTLKLWVVIAKVPVFRIIAQLGAWDQGLGVPIRLELPGGEILTKMLINPNIDFLLDFNKMQGAKINTSLAEGPGEFGIVDGKVDEFEKNAKISLEDNWLWLESQHGWDVFFTFDAPSDLDVGLSFFYEDSIKDTHPSETDSGANPRMGYRIDRLPKDKLKIDVDITFWFPDTAGSGGAPDFHEKMANPPKMKITEISQ